jgi:hypothetical protein
MAMADMLLEYSLVLDFGRLPNNNFRSLAWGANRMMVKRIDERANL